MRRLALCLFFVFGLALSPGHRVHAEPPQTHEIIYSRPSGFWTSNRPAVGGAYRWRLLGVGGAVLLAMGLLTWRVVRRANPARAAR